MLIRISLILAVVAALAVLFTLIALNQTPLYTIY